MKRHKKNGWGARQYFLLGSGLLSAGFEIGACSALVEARMNKEYNPTVQSAPAKQYSSNNPANEPEKNPAEVTSQIPANYGQAEEQEEKPMSGLENSINIYLDNKNNVDSIKKCLERTVKFNEYISRAYEKNNIDEYLISAVISVESGGNPNAISRGNDAGLMQISPITAKELNMPLTARTNPNSVIKASAYLSRLVNAHGLELGIAAYNCGPTRVANLKK